MHQTASIAMLLSRKLIQEYYYNTLGTAGGPGGRDRTMAVKSKKKTTYIFFAYIFQLCQNIWGNGRFLEVGQKQKTEKDREKERLNDGNNNGQLRIANATSGGA